MLAILFTVAGVLTATIVVIPFGNVIDIPDSRLTNFVFVGLRYFVACLIVAGAHRIAIRQAAKAVVPLSGDVSHTTGLIATFLLRTFVYEAFVVPTNSMAPTLLGEHLEARCPDCGSPTYGSPPDPSRPGPHSEVRTVICSKELRSFFAPAVK